MRLLFIRFSSLGDTILTTGILKNVREQLPNATIDVLTFSAFADVYRLCGSVSQVYTIEKGVSLAEYREFLTAIRTKSRRYPTYDFIFDLHDNPRSAIARKTLTGKAFVYEKSSLMRRLYVALRLFKKKLNKHVVQRYAEAVFIKAERMDPQRMTALDLRMPSFEELRPAIPMAAQLCIEQNAMITPTIPSLRATPTPAKGNKKIILHPFASKFTKIWPQFPALAERLVQAGWSVKVLGKGDFPIIDGVERADTPSIADMFCYMADAALVVSTDSGPLHAAVALNVPLVAIFGSTTKELGFYPSFEHCRVVERNDVPCRPCHVHGRNKCVCDHFDCMNKITIDDVIKAIEEVI